MTPLFAILLFALAQRPAPNVLLIVADDVGRDWIGAYGEGPAAPCTPNIDSIAANGVLFRRYYTAPSCSPSRGMLQTGNYPFRSRLGSNIGEASQVGGLPVTSTTIADAVPGSYARAMFGKWHLSSSNQGNTHPNDVGWPHFVGTRHNIGSAPLVGPACATEETYAIHHEVEDGVEFCVSEYATTHTTDRAIDFIAGAESPWLVVVSYNASHNPLHEPPGLCPPGCPCPAPSTDAEMFARMTQAMDLEVGRLLSCVRSSDTYVIFASDNGTSKLASLADDGECFSPTTSKGSYYEGGIRVPLLISGPRVPQGVETSILVEVTDLFATVAGLTGGSAASAVDSLSLAPLILNRARSAPRETVYIERYGPNGPVAGALWRDQVAVDSEWKLIRRTAGSSVVEELYDLVADPCEEVDLISLAPGISAYAELSDFIDNVD